MVWLVIAPLSEHDCVSGQSGNPYLQHERGLVSMPEATARLKSKRVHILFHFPVVFLVVLKKLSVEVTFGLSLVTPKKLVKKAKIVDINVLRKLGM